MKEKFWAFWNGKFISGAARFSMAWMGWDMSTRRDGFEDYSLKTIAIFFAIIGVRIWMRAFRQWQQHRQTRTS